MSASNAKKNRIRRLKNTYSQLTVPELVQIRKTSHSALERTVAKSALLAMLAPQAPAYYHAIMFRTDDPVTQREQEEYMQTAEYRDWRAARDAAEAHINELLCETDLTPQSGVAPGAF